MLLPLWAWRVFRSSKIAVSIVYLCKWVLRCLLNVKRATHHTVLILITALPVAAFGQIQFDSWSQLLGWVEVQLALLQRLDVALMVQVFLVDTHLVQQLLAILLELLVVHLHFAFMSFLLNVGEGSDVGRKEVLL